MSADACALPELIEAAAYPGDSVKVDTCCGSVTLQVREGGIERADYMAPWFKPAESKALRKALKAAEKQAIAYENEWNS